MVAIGRIRNDGPGADSLQPTVTTLVVLIGIIIINVKTIPIVLPEDNGFRGTIQRCKHSRSTGTQTTGSGKEHKA